MLPRFCRRCNESCRCSARGRTRLSQAIGVQRTSNANILSAGPPAIDQRVNAAVRNAGFDKHRVQLSLGNEASQCVELARRRVERGGCSLDSTNFKLIGLSEIAECIVCGNQHATRRRHLRQGGVRIPGLIAPVAASNRLREHDNPLHAAGSYNSSASRTTSTALRHSTHRAIRVDRAPVSLFNNLASLMYWLTAYVGFTVASRGSNSPSLASRPRPE